MCRLVPGVLCSLMIFDKNKKKSIGNARCQKHRAFFVWGNSKDGLCAGLKNRRSRVATELPHRFAPLAQLVQSACLTSKRSLVRTQQGAHSSLSTHEMVCFKKHWNGTSGIGLIGKPPHLGCGHHIGSSPVFPTQWWGSSVGRASA